MKVETPQLLWHPEAEKGLPAALMSLDILESGASSSSSSVKSYVLATCGNSSDVHLWKVEMEPLSATSSSVTKIDFLTSLTRHDGPVNVCKFSPDGLHIVTAGDSGAVVIYSVPLEKRGNSNGKHFWWYLTKENDLTVRIVARHGDGVTDASWSQDSQRFMLSTIDHAVLILEANGPSDWKIIFRNSSNHSHYVQGVAYDPLNVYLASAAADRSVRILTRKQPAKYKKAKQVLITKATNNLKDDGASGESTVANQNPDALIQEVLNNAKLELNMKAKLIKYRKIEETANPNENTSRNKHYWFADECNLESFVRRLAWTPDGAYLIVPAGQTEETYATVVFKRHQFDQPHRILGGLEKPSVAVCPNPVLFQLPTSSVSSKSDTVVISDLPKENLEAPSSQFKNSSELPYRCLFAVLTWDSVIIYDTFHSQPLAIAKNMHYANLVDGCWTADGYTLLVCSTDGYVSIIQFTKEELGEIYEKQEQQPKSPFVHREIKIQKASPPSKPLPPCEPGPVTFDPPVAKKKRIAPTPITAEAKSATTKDESPKINGQETRSEDLQSSHKRPIEATTEAVDKLSIDSVQNKKQKKRILPTLVGSLTS